jgi:hypothetical protein
MYDPTLGPEAPQKLALQTRKGGTIENLMNPAELYAGVDLQVAALRATYPNASHRPVGPSARYNCHGLTFASRRTAIGDSGQVQRILNDDAYRKLDLGENPSPGDIAVYREGGDIIHSGVIVGSRDGIPMVLGKWGDCQEVIHAVSYCPYNTAAVSYYRLMK